MSIEKAIQENTEAVLALNRNIEALLAAGRLGGVDGANEVKLLSPAAATKVVKNEQQELTFKAVREKFLDLVNANRDAALGVLEKYKLKKLTEEGLPSSEFQNFLNAVEEASNG